MYSVKELAHSSDVYQSVANSFLRLKSVILVFKQLLCLCMNQPWRSQMIFYLFVLWCVRSVM